MRSKSYRYVAVRFQLVSYISSHYIYSIPLEQSVEINTQNLQKGKN